MSASSFSYAQAAKGQSAAPSNSSPTPGDKAPEPQVATTDEAAVPEAPQANPAEATEVAEAAATTDVRSASPENQDMENAQVATEGDAKLEATPEKVSEPKRDDEVSRLDRPWRRTDKATRSSSTTTRSADDQESRKGRRNKKAKTSEKQPGDQPAAEKEQEAEPEAPKVELAEAPIPSVNIWHQRKEAQLAKGKSPVAGSTETSDSPEGAKASTKPSEESNASVTTRDVAPINGVKTQRKVAEPSRPERNGPRGSRVAEKEARDGKGGHPPPVADASSWPTPETAIKETAVKEVARKNTDRADRSDKDSQEDGSQSKSRKKGWVAYDYVPSVSFETQLPAMRGGKARGAARGARDTNTRASTVADKAPSAAPASKASESKERAKEANASTHASSPPPTGKRASLDAAPARDQKKAPGQGVSDKSKDSSSNPVENAQAPRDRPEGRGERSRGGYRGRGGHHAQAQHQHSASAAAAAGFPARSSGLYSPPPRQGSHGGAFMPPAQRGRGGRNSGNYHRMSLPNGNSRAPPVQPQFGLYEYPLAPTSAINYQDANVPSWDSMHYTMLRTQIEYYFSIENLCKDVYLRRRMDSQGFVPLHFISAFKRIQELTKDLNLVRTVCEHSMVVDFVVGEDECERLRSRDHWQKFVLPMEDRDELARTNGPTSFTYRSSGYAYGNHFSGTPYGVTSPPAFPQAHEMPLPQFHGGGHAANGVNGVTNGNGASQLSAAVPDFSPSASAIVGGADIGKLKAAVSSAPHSVASLDQNHATANAGGYVPNGLPNGAHTQEPNGSHS